MSFSQISTKLTLCALVACKRADLGAMCPGISSSLATSSLQIEGCFLRKKNFFDVFNDPKHTSD